MEVSCRLEDNIVTYKAIARQRLGKHIPAGASARSNGMSVARQRMSKRLKQYGTIEDGVFLEARPEAI
jgi:hypothetical protein